MTDDGLQRWQVQLGLPDRILSQLMAVRSELRVADTPQSSTAKRRRGETEAR